jgi:hypothetical protein
LPPSVATFISDATNIPPGAVLACWILCKDDAWSMPAAVCRGRGLIPHARLESGPKYVCPLPRGNCIADSTFW